MALVKTVMLGQTKVYFYDDCVPKDQDGLRKNVETVYDTVNDIALGLNSKVTKDWPLTEKKREFIKKSGEYNLV